MRPGETSYARSLHGSARPGDVRGLSLKPPKWLRKAQPGKILKKALPVVAGVGLLAIPGVGAAAAGALGAVAKGAGSVIGAVGRNAGTILDAASGAVNVIGGAAGSAGQTVIDSTDELTEEALAARGIIVRTGAGIQNSAAQAERAFTSPLSFADSIPGGATTVMVGGAALLLIVVLLATRKG